MGTRETQDELGEFTLPAGTLCHRNGMPFALAADTVICCNPANWPELRGPSAVYLGEGPCPATAAG